jgi:hypothetical protein
MSVPTLGDEFAKMTFHMRHAQEAAAMIAHLYNAHGDNDDARRWIVISENFKKMIHQVTQIYMRRAN